MSGALGSGGWAVLVPRIVDDPDPWNLPEVETVVLDTGLPLNSTFRGVEISLKER